jgi:hypothetical protein
MTAALISSQTGVSAHDLMMGNLDPAKIGVELVKARRKVMQSAMRGGMNVETAASIFSRRFGGNIEEWKRAAGISAAQVTGMEEQAKRDEINARKVDNLRKALDQLTSGPVAKMSALLATFNRVALEAGTNVLQMVNSWTAWVDHKIPALHKALDHLFHWLTDEHGKGFAWAVGVTTKAVTILVPVLGIKMLKALVDVSLASGHFISVFRKMTTAIEVGSEVVIANARAQEKSNAQQREVFTTLKKGEVEAAAQGGKGGWIKNIFRMLGFHKLPGLGKVLGGAVPEAGAEVAGKVGGEALEKGGVKLLERGGLKALGKGAAKLGSKALGSVAPIVGEIISIGWAVSDIIQMWSDPKGTKGPMLIFKTILKGIGGLIGGLTPLGFLLSAGIDMWVGAMDKNTEATDKNTEKEKDKEKKEKFAVTKGMAAPSIGAGRGLEAGVSDIYAKPGVRTPAETEAAETGGVAQSVGIAGTTETTGGAAVTPGGAGGAGTEGGGGIWGWGGAGGAGAPGAAPGARVGGKVGKPTLRPFENISNWGGPGGAGGQPLIAGKKGKIPRAVVESRLTQLVANSALNNFIPEDGPRYGIRSGSPQEWAHLLTAMVDSESGFNPRDKDVAASERAISGGAGSHGLFSLSPSDPENYGVGPNVPLQQLYNPEYNLELGVAIAAKLATKYGVIVGRDKKGGWAGLGRYWGPLRRGEVKIPTVEPGAERGALAAAGSATGAGARMMAEGGIVNQPTTAVLGERGPEAVIPLSSSQKTLNSVLSVLGKIPLHGMWKSEIFGLQHMGMPEAETEQRVESSSKAARRFWGQDLWRAIREIGHKIGETEALGNEQVVDHFGALTDAELKRRGGRAALGLREGARTPSALTERGGEENGLAAADGHNAAILQELRTSNRMHRERLFYVRRDRFVGPTLLASAAENTLANA